MDDNFDYENIPKKTILVDFDNVIHNSPDGWQGGKIYGQMMPGAKESIEKLVKFGFEVVVCTARDNLDLVRVWLAEHGLALEVTNQKQPSIAIIDDRAIRFTNWPDILRYFV
jgi:hypothetical protein